MQRIYIDDGIVYSVPGIWEKQQIEITAATAAVYVLLYIHMCFGCFPLLAIFPFDLMMVITLTQKKQLF